MDLLKTRQEISDINITDSRVRCRWGAGRHMLPELHRRIVAAGVDLIALAVKTDNLEDIYMKIARHKTS